MEELQKTLKVDDIEYNINAVHSDTASQVVNKLILKKTNLSTGEPSSREADWTEFDGSVEKVLNIVPSSGGGFSGNITVPPYKDTIRDESVLNSSDIKKFIVNELKSNSVLYTWNGTKLTGGGEGSSIKSISIITGNDANKNSFATKNNENYLAYKNNDTTKSFVSAFIYISTDDGNLGNIYFGTCEANEVTGVQVNADNANTAGQLASTQHFSVSLESSAEVDFNGTCDAPLGVTGILPISKGGTGATTAEEARTNLGISLKNLDAAPSNHTHLYAGSATAGGAATSALAATKDSLGNNISAYYQPKILTGNEDPNKSTVDAVKKAPDGAIYIQY